jgi:hypothetical protein
MKASLKTTSATPAFVLEVLRDNHRHQCAFDPEAEPDVELGFHTTVAEWRNACDLVETDSLGGALNDMWEIELPEGAWRTVLEPPNERTLRDVCELIAERAEQLSIQPAGAFGASCEMAGAFLTVRALLLRAGAPGSALKPSAPVAEMARQFPAVFLGPIARLAPGRLPKVAIKTPWYTAAVSVMTLGILGTAAGYFIAPTVVGWSLTVVAIGWIATWGAARLRPAAVQFGAIKTFWDLAAAISSKPTA